MEFPQHGHVILDLLRPCKLEVGDNLPLVDIFDRGDKSGIGRDEIEDALLSASANGWVIAVGDQLQLTASGHALVNPANDN